MRIMSILTACLVAAVLYGVVFERDRLLEFSREVAPASQDDAAEGGPDPVDVADPAPEAAAPDALPEGAVRVMAKRSVAQVVDSEVILRGETQAVRQVEVRAEISGKIVSEPLRKGSLVEAGQLLCEIDPGTSQVSLQEALAPHEPDILCLAGFMRVLTAGFVTPWEGRMLNIHPSLLPKYRGLNTHARAIAAGDSEAGCTVHEVTPELDDGPILGQARVPILPDDSAEALAARVLTMEHQLYPAVLRRFAAGDRTPVQLP